MEVQEHQETAAESFSIHVPGRLEGRGAGATGYGASRVWCKKPDSRMFLGSSLGASRISVTVFARNTT